MIAEAPPSDGSAGETVANQPPEVDAKLLELLVCPLTKTTLEYDRAARELISRAAGLAFPIRNGVPLLVEDAARVLDPHASSRR